jgi:hypothetical protein
VVEAHGRPVAETRAMLTLVVPVLDEFEYRRGRLGRGLERRARNWPALQGREEAIAQGAGCPVSTFQGVMS